MEKNKKYALLDTDFIYKCHLARNFKEDTLAELVLDFEEYEFFCHEMIKEELSRKEIDPNPNPWLELKVQTGKIRLYSDQDIVNKLSKIYGELATLMYVDLLRNSCDTFDKGFFSRYYSALEYAENITDLDYFLTVLKACDAKVPPQNGLGEKKTYVLIHKVWSLSGQQRIKIPIMQVLEDIYDGKFQLLGNGDLRYIKKYIIENDKFLCALKQYTLQGFFVQ